jgi:hypothetical protein
MKAWDQMTSCPFFALFSIIMWKILIFINPFHLMQVPTEMKQEFWNTWIQYIIFFVFFSHQLLEINFYEQILNNLQRIYKKNTVYY